MPPRPLRQRRWPAPLLAAALCLPAMACALDLSEAKTPVEIADQQVSDGPRTLHLPAGAWWDLDHYAWTASAGSRVGRVDSSFIARIEHGTIGLAGRIVLLEYDLPARSWRDEPCGGVQDIFAKEYSATIDLKDCLVVRSERVKDMQALLTRTFPKAVDWIARQGMKLPEAAVRIRYARFATSTFGILDLYVPAEYFDSEQAAVAWAESLRASLKPMFEHRETDATLPPLPVPAEAPAEPASAAGR